MAQIDRLRQTRWFCTNRLLCQATTVLIHEVTVDKSVAVRNCSAEPSATDAINPSKVKLTL